MPNWCEPEEECTGWGCSCSWCQYTAEQEKQREREDEARELINKIHDPKIQADLVEKYNLNEFGVLADMRSWLDQQDLKEELQNRSRARTRAYYSKEVRYQKKVTTTEETERAWKVRRPDGKTAWIPKSQCRLESTSKKEKYRLYHPRWMCIEWENPSEQELLTDRRRGLLAELDEIDKKLEELNAK